MNKPEARDCWWRWFLVIVFGCLKTAKNDPLVLFTKVSKFDNMESLLREDWKLTTKAFGKRTCCHFLAACNSLLTPGNVG